MSDTDTISGSEVDIVDNIAEFDENWRFLFVAEVKADLVCRRLDKLIRNGNISKDQIFYIYGQHDTNVLDSKHLYDKDVIEFFASIVHHGRESRYNIVRGAMGFGSRQNSLN